MRRRLMNGFSPSLRMCPAHHFLHRLRQSSVPFSMEQFRLSLRQFHFFFRLNFQWPKGFRWLCLSSFIFVIIFWLRLRRRCLPFSSRLNPFGYSATCTQRRSLSLGTRWTGSVLCFAFFLLQIRTLLTEIDYTLVSRHGCRLASASHSPPPSFLLFFFSFSKPSTLFPSPFLIYPPVGIALQWVGRAFQKVLSSWLILRVGAKSKIHGSLAAFLLLFECKGKTIYRGSWGGWGDDEVFLEYAHRLRSPHLLPLSCLSLF